MSSTHSCRFPDTQYLFVKNLLSSDVSKLLVFLITTFFFAALLTPYVHNFGSLLAELTTNKSVNPIIDYIGNLARKANYADYFNRALCLVALIFLPALLFSFNARKGIATRRGPWSIALPFHSVAPNRGQALTHPQHPLGHLLGGLFLGALFLLTVGAIALMLDLFHWEPVTASFVVGALLTALLISILQEFVFRGVILGIFLRTFRPSLAIALVAALYSFLLAARPSEGANVAYPNNPLAGFTFLELSARHLLSDLSFLKQWTTFFFVGILLGLSRHLTSSLWLPIGLHTGWAFAFLFFKEFAQPTNKSLDLPYQFVGDNLAQGLLPLGALFVCGFIVWLIYREPNSDEELTPAEHPNPAFSLPPNG